MGLRPTQADEKTPFVRGRSPMEAPPSPLSSRPKRTQISCHAALDKARCAPFFEERRTMFANATYFDRKSGVAQWRDLRFFSVLTQTLRPSRTFCCADRGLSRTRTCTFHYICPLPSDPRRLRSQIKKDCAAYQSEAPQRKLERHEHCGQEESKCDQGTDRCKPAGLVGNLVSDRPSQNMVLE